MAVASIDFISGASNRVANCCALVTVQENTNEAPNTETTIDIACYGVGNSVALLNLNKYNGIELTLQGHSDRVNCVSILEYGKQSEKFEIISGSSDNTIKIWSKTPENKWTCASTLSEHTESVIYLKSIFLRNENNEFSHIIASCSVDGAVKIWRKNSKATGNTDSKIHFYVWDQITQGFHKKVMLEGHEDWVTSLSSTAFFDFSESEKLNSAISHWNNGDVILASASQDRYCRLWKISCIEFLDNCNEDLQSSKKNEILNALQTGDASQLSVRKHGFTVGNKSYKLELESVLSGHDDWIHSAYWQSPRSSLDDLQLVTASADQSILLWKPEADSGVWASEARFGEVGGSVYGFFNSLLNRNGDLILAIGYHGSLHIWRLLTTDDDATLSWVQDVSPTGHFESVTDIQWEPYGRYFLTHSLDKTARIFGNWKTQTKNPEFSNVWHEISRPQIHGYELNCATFVNPSTYASGADEKVVRIFESPSHFSEIYNQLCIGLALDDATKQRIRLETKSSDGKSKAIEAAIPPLGLSNKAIFQDEIDAETKKNQMDIEQEQEHELRRKTQVESYVIEGSNESAAVPSSALHPSGHPPLEESLRRRTLWPEVEKIYGHPYETFAIANSASSMFKNFNNNESCQSNSQKSWISVSCKAKSAKNAGVRLYDTQKWRPAQVFENENGQNVSKEAAPLLAHTLTVTKMAFQPKPSLDSENLNNDLLLTVGRDRSISLFKIVGDANNESIPSECKDIQLFQHIEKAHLRIVWDCDWSPDGKFFATVSRDKVMKIWGNDTEDGKFVALKSVKLPDSGTSISVTTDPSNTNGYWIAVGLEQGSIVIFNIAVSNSNDSILSLEINELLTLLSEITHNLKVNRLSWRPTNEFNFEYKIATQRQLLSCSDDYTVRLFTITN
ncbi:hypothetical protein BB561_001981 [Smittium simulii]|uniref:Elongator complex protein 2 n=1 Tax=Smittium simulii TaxID=133385 RepID=A0A2T9YS34_9FUNG|nr:hypothetical protein BB561_001981 [Smittium simulii]